MRDEGSFPEAVSWIAEHLEHPDVDLDVCSVCQRFNKTKDELYSEIKQKHPIRWQASGRSFHEADHNPGVTEMIAKFGVTDQDAARIKETAFLYRQVLPQGHLIGIVGMSGSGKTTILERICGQLESRVLYINADISASDVPEAKRRAEEGGYALLCPDIKVGRSLDDVLHNFQELARSDEDLSGVVFVIDTLKKFTDLINKAKAAETYKLFRSLTGRGATVICLGHCNKYPDPDGWPVYEGTGDLRSDFDELGLLHAHKGDYGMLTVSLYWDEQGWPLGKTRAVLQPQSWEIDRENGRQVRELDDWLDTVKLSKEFHETRQTADVIREIYLMLLRNGSMTQSAVLQRTDGRHSKRAVRQVLKQQAGKAWEISTGRNNAQIHTAIEGADIPKAEVSNWGKQR